MSPRKPLAELLASTAAASLVVGLAVLHHRRRRRRHGASRRVLKTVTFYRHGQGEHNLTAPDGKSQQLQVFDAKLTAQGEREARAIGENMSAAPEVAFVSPLWRTCQTADLALSALGSEGRRVPLFALEDVREGVNWNACNHRRPMGSEHQAAFPALDLSLIKDAIGPPSGIEHQDDLRDQIEQVRRRVRRVLQFLESRPEANIAIFSHQGFIRNVGAVVVGLDRQHTMGMPETGSAFKVLLVEEAGCIRWQLGHDTSITVLAVAWR